MNTMAIIGLFCKEINNKELLFIKNKFLNPIPQPIHLPRDLRGGCDAGDYKEFLVILVGCLG
ncbi:hypothetical protein, partial [uncultured Selenomonas sp.]|uniref:hypothetical protein n=1 Tax=uncultured Selenomonas sp. TaxID=159275 RepID=UPI0025901087